MYNFVANKKVIDSFKSSEYFQKSLGRATSTDRGKKDGRQFKINDADVFTKFFFDKYRIALFTEGSMGDINFFTNHYLTDQIAVYYNDAEFVFEHNPDLFRKKGVHGYIGSFIKEIETKYIEEIKHTGSLIEAVVEKPDPNKIYNNPGQVRYEDLMAYLEVQKNKKKLS